MEFEPESYSAVLAKRFVSATLESWGLEDLDSDVRLLVSELVSNAIVHAASRFKVVAELGPEQLRVEVLDKSPFLPTNSEVSTFSKSGRGLTIVDALADRSGVQVLEDGKAVWFTLKTAHALSRRCAPREPATTDA
jgi:anti-sigma regulatory factor (Ser/Thr protein kinase)